MRDLSLTKSERFLLNEVDSVPDKVVRWSLLSRAPHRLTVRGFSRVIDGLLRRNLLSRNYDTVTLTWNGILALREAA